MIIVMLAEMSMAPILFNIIERKVVKSNRYTVNIFGVLDALSILTAIQLKIPDFSAPYTSSIIPAITPSISMSIKLRTSSDGTAPIASIDAAARREL